MKNFSDARLVVVKLGTNIIMKKNRLNRLLIRDIARQVSALRRKGIKVIIITSGAMGLGLERMHLNSNGLPLEMQQASAAVGQSILMHNYELAFSKYNEVIAQLLLARNNFSNQLQSQNLERTMKKLLELGVVPIINENDPVATDELIKEDVFSDNDMLAALVASKFGADLLIIVTDVEGLYTADPKREREAVFIREVRNADEINALLEGPSAAGRGGFKTKIAAARKASAAGVTTIICKGRKRVLEEIFSGNCPGTVFSAE